jgi:hypothetical protein
MPKHEEESDDVAFARLVKELLPESSFDRHSTDLAMLRGARLVTDRP